MRTLTIAFATWREAVRQPVSIIVLCIAVAITFLSQFLNFYHFDDESGFDMMRQMSMAGTLICGIVIAIFSASAVLDEEIENRTVVTLLAKPVRRYEIILGKFLGVLLAIAVTFIIMMIVSLGTCWWSETWGSEARRNVSWRVNPVGVAGDLPALATGQGALQVASSYEELFSKRDGQGLNYLYTVGDLLLLGSGQSTPLVARAPLSASTENTPGPSLGLAALMTDVVAPLTDRTQLQLQGFALAFAQVMIITAVSIAVSTRLPLVFNALVCLAVFVFGNLSFNLGRYLLGSGGGEGGSLLALLKWPVVAACNVLPCFETLDLTEALQVGIGPVGPGRVLYGMLYGITYTALVLFLAVLFFERREVA
jgi:hypothetical protein